MSRKNQQSSLSIPRRAAIRCTWLIVQVICFIMAATAFLPMFSVDWWWVRIGDFPRLQLLISYVLTLGILSPFYRRKVAWCWTAVLLVCVVIQCARIFPYLPIAPQEVRMATTEDDGSRLRIVSANVLQDNPEYYRLLNLVHDVTPDVLALVEVNREWLDALSPLKKQYPHHVLHPLENKYGIALYSKYPLKSQEVRFVVKDDIPSIDAIITLPNGHDVRLFVVHPNPPRPGEDTAKRDGELVLIARDVANYKNSAVVTGDLNDVGWSKTTNLFQEVSGLLDPRKGRGLFATYNAKTWIWRYPLDHLFHTDDFCVVELRTLRDIGSDHFPLLVELSYEPAAAALQAAPELDAGDREDADDLVERAKTEVNEKPQNSAMP